MNDYEPSTPRVALGIASVAIAVITLGVGVILPAQMDSGRREPRILAALKVTAPAFKGLATVTRIDVVSGREPGSSTLSVRIGEAEPLPGRLTKTTSPAIVRVSSD